MYYLIVNELDLSKPIYKRCLERKNKTQMEVYAGKMQKNTAQLLKKVEEEDNIEDEWFLVPVKNIWILDRCKSKPQFAFVSYLHYKMNPVLNSHTKGLCIAKFKI